jgi:hypothetical protein
MSDLGRRADIGWHWARKPPVADDPLRTSQGAGHNCYVRFAYGFESGFATSRTQSMKSCAAGLRVRFLRVTIPTGLG